MGTMRAWVDNLISSFNNQLSVVGNINKVHVV